MIMYNRIGKKWRTKVLLFTKKADIFQSVPPSRMLQPSLQSTVLKETAKN
jgi:hypothetical protein